jgi:hypothetical protein
LDGYLAECLLHAWAKDSYHHLLKRTKKGFVMFAQNEIRSILERLQVFLFLLLGCGVALPWQQYPGHFVLQVGDATPVLFERQQTLLLELVYGVLELLLLLRREILKVDIHDVCDFRHLDSFGCVPPGVPKSVLTRNVHPAPNTQQAEQSWLHTRKESRDAPVNFS